MRDWLERVWYRPAPPPPWLRPLSAVYGTVAQRVAERRRRLAQRLPVPVIVVGNVTVGGTGKTPCVLGLAALLQRLGHRPGLVSRGYGGRGPFPCEVSPDSDPRRCGDEPVLIAQRSGLPMMVAPDRVTAARALLQRHPDIDVLLCDDGLQHYALARDLEVCVIDGARGYGNGYLLPAGPLREPAARAAQAQLLLVNGADAAAYGERALRFDLVLQDAVNLATGERRSLAAFAGEIVDAVAGIGHPARFFASLRGCGLRLREHAFADHHAYRPADLAFPGGAPLLMTEKDAVKCRSFAQPHWWAVPAQLQFERGGEERVRAGVEAAMRRSSPAGILTSWN